MERLPFRTILITVLSSFLLSVTWMSFSRSEARAADVAKGKAIYEKQCALCHGRAGKGDGPVAKSLNPAPTSFSSKEMIGHLDERHRKVMVEGKGTMPSFTGQLSQQEIDDVLAYTRTLAK